jgi:DNA-binding transcriptional ArsR family regulator
MKQESSADGRSGDGATPAGTGRQTLDADDLFGALADSVNRYVLYYLIKVNRPTSTNELIEYAVGSVSPPGGTVGEFRGETRAAVERALPKLDALGLVRYYEDGSIVEPTERTAVAEPYLALALEHLD